MKKIRIERIAISNYKGIDSLTVHFPEGKMTSDPDINILGSKNGIGKTSVLECCALMLFAASTPQAIFQEGLRISYSDIIRSGAKKTSIWGVVSVDGTLHKISLSIQRDGRIQTLGGIKNLLSSNGNTTPDIFNRILGMYPDPVSEKCFFFLHSYRKIQEGKPELGMLIDDDTPSFVDRRIPMRYRMIERETISFSLFKRIIVRYLMEEANLFEPELFKKHAEDQKAPHVLNDLLKTYANVKIGKLRPYRNNTIDVQVEKVNEPSQSFSIDGLSSGQKEIISTLFMIWNTTQNKSSVVMIDEPELHLNAHWHAGFVDKLLQIAPNNQYIMATHAEAIMASVNKENRILLAEGDKK